MQVLNEENFKTKSHINSYVLIRSTEFLDRSLNFIKPSNFFNGNLYSAILIKIPGGFFYLTILYEIHLEK